MKHLLSALLLLAPLLAPATAAERWNLVAVVTDDQAEWTVGAYGNRESRTPNMDRLAREGARFLHAFTATPVCSPSRATYLTGRYGTELGITDWISPDEAGEGLGLPASAVTWPAVLQKHGYRTGIVGKWHLGMQEQFHPGKRGFDHFMGFLGGGTTPMDAVLEVNGKNQKVEGPLPDRLTDDAIRFVEANQKEPFALLLHFRAPHLPYGPVPREDSEPFEKLDPTVPQRRGLEIPQVKKWTRDYYASIHSVDRNLGRLLAKLDALGLSERTVVLFTSDHGYNVGHHGIHTKGNGVWVAGGVNGPKRPNMWDTSVRVPLLVRWPGVVKPGTEIPQPVSNIDMFPSALGMLGVPVPEGTVQRGADFAPLLRGQTVPWRDAVYSQFDLHNGGLAYMRMVRTSEWKLVRHHYARGLDELYHLKDDPGENRNLVNNAAHRKTRDALQEKLTAWMRSIDDPVLRDPRAR